MTQNFLILYREWTVSPLTQTESQDERIPREIFCHFFKRKNGKKWLAVSFKTIRFSYCCIFIRESSFLQPLTSKKIGLILIYFSSLSLLLFWFDFQIFEWRGMIERRFGVHRGSRSMGHPTLSCDQQAVLATPCVQGPIWCLKYTLVTDLKWSFTHTPDLQDCNHKMCVWSRTVGTHSPVWNTSVCKVSLWHRSPLTHTNNFYQFRGTTDLAMHSHIKARKITVISTMDDIIHM